MGLWREKAEYKVTVHVNYNHVKKEVCYQSNRHPLMSMWVSRYHSYWEKKRGLFEEIASSGS